jgi:hypothetical protein
MPPVQMILIALVVILGLVILFKPKKRKPSAEAPAQKEPTKRKSISMIKCFGIIITSLIALCILLIPVNGQAAFLSMPLVGDGSIVEFNEIMLLSFTSLVGIGEDLFNFLSIVLEYGSTVYMLAPIAASGMAVIMLIIRFEFLRKLFRLICIILGVAMTINMLAQLVVVIGVFGMIIESIKGGVGSVNFAGVLLPLLMFFASSFLSKKLLKWFK